MRILISVSSMVRLVAVCFVLGVVLGLYFGVAGTPDASPAPPPDPVPVQATAP
jgi:hypothetical protein